MLPVPDARRAVALRSQGLELDEGEAVGAVAPSRKLDLAPLLFTLTAKS